MNKQDYWYYLEPWVHLSKEGNKLLLYNTHNGKVVEYSETPPEIEFLIKKLTQKDNLWVAKINNSDFINANISSFISKTRKQFIGDIMPVIKGQTKPVQFVPLSKLNNDYNIKNNFGNLDNILEYLNSITFYLNSYNPDIYPKNAYKQFLFPIHNNSQEELNIDIISDIFKNYTLNYLNFINIIGGNIFLFSKFKPLLVILRKINASISFNFCPSDIDPLNKFTYNNFVSLLELDAENFELNCFIFNKKNFFEVNKYKDKLHFTFICSSETDYADYINIIEDYKITKLKILPIINNNSNFINKNVKFSKRIIFESIPSQKEIISRKYINKNSFGKIYIMSNKKVYSNLNSKTIGDLTNSSLNEIINKEVYSNKNWRFTRDLVIPCKTCLYKYLCPPISNYERSLNDFKMCRGI